MSDCRSLDQPRLTCDAPFDQRVGGDSTRFVCSQITGFGGAAKTVWCRHTVYLQQSKLCDRQIRHPRLHVRRFGQSRTRVIASSGGFETVKRHCRTAVDVFVLQWHQKQSSVSAASAAVLLSAVLLAGGEKLSCSKVFALNCPAAPKSPLLADCRPY